SDPVRRPSLSTGHFLTGGVAHHRSANIVQRGTGHVPGQVRVNRPDRAGAQMREPSRLRWGEQFDISVVVPCLNEAENIHALHEEIVEHLGEHALEIIYVDDGSTDSTLALVRELAGSDPRVSYLALSRNFGLESAF